MVDCLGRAVFKVPGVNVPGYDVVAPLGKVLLTLELAGAIWWAEVDGILAEDVDQCIF